MEAQFRRSFFSGWIGEVTCDGGDCLNCGEGIEPLTIHRPRGPGKCQVENARNRQALSLPFDLVKLDMDHVTDTDTYHDIQSLGTEKLR